MRDTTNRDINLRGGVTLTTDREVISHAEWLAEARRRFGERVGQWAFLCPRCGERQTVDDFAAAKSGEASQECIGRHLEGRGCDWAAFGLLGTLGKGRLVEVSSGVVEVFEFAPTDERT